MPRRKFWKRGAANKKGNSHPSNHGFTIDDDLVKPPVKKVKDDQVKPPVKKVLKDQVKPPVKKVIANEKQSHCQNNCQSHCQNHCQSHCQNHCQSQSIQNEQSNYETTSENSGQVHDVSETENTYFASHNQADTMYSSFSRGSQCTCMSLSMILSLQDETHFSTDALDLVLHHGDNLYRKVVLDLKNTGKFRNSLLSFDELPLALQYRERYFSLVKHTTVYGLPVIQSNTSEILSLHEGLIFALTKSHHLLVMIGAICSAVVMKDNKYYFFDSHSHGPDGLSSPEGKAILKIFEALDELVLFLYSFYISCNIDLASQFEILPVSIERFVHNFLNFEPANTAKYTDRQSYMKQYMQKRRQDAKFRQKERQTEVVGKRTAREDPEYRDKERKTELLGKRTARENPEYHIKELLGKRSARQIPKYRNKELLAKRTAREDPMYRDKERKTELLGKRTARENPEYHIKELLGKHSARQIPKYRNKELLGKRTAREDPMYRDKERKTEQLGKRTAREDPEYRDKERKTELLGKRTAREDPEYRDKERKTQLLGKRTAREDPEYRDKERQTELLGKRTARENPEYRNKELHGKRTARKDPMYRDKERKQGSLSRKKRRECSEYREKERRLELRLKRLARSYPRFKLKERLKGLKSKQRLRRNKYFLELERLKKQHARKCSRDKERISDKKRKRSNRSNFFYKAREQDSVMKRKYGSTVEKCIELFHSSTSTGPIYVCSCCHQTWFSESMTKVESLKSNVSFQPGILTGMKSVQDKEWICRTCLSNIKKNKVPKLSVLNGMKWPNKPAQLNLHPLEERLISLRIPFMQIRELPRGRQYCVKGNVINVPVEIQPTVNALPRQMDENFTIPVKLKKKLSYKKCDFTENVRPTAVLSALHWLMSGSELYKNSGVQVDSSWAESVTSDSREIIREFLSPSADFSASADVGDENQQTPQNNGDTSTNENTTPEDKNPHEGTGYESDNFSEIDSAENVTGNSDTLLDDDSLNTDRSYTFAPGEGQHPLSLYTDHDAESLSFPTIFCGQKRPGKKDRKVPVHYTDIAKWELRSKDRRAAQSVPNIFFKLKKIQLKQISDKVQLAVRRYKTKGKKITAGEARNQSTLDKMVLLDEGYYIFRQLRNSPAYLASKKKDVFAMIRQLGLPTWFMSLSSADTRWSFLLKALSQLDGINLSDEEVAKLSWNEKTKLVQKDPITCSRIFDERVRKFIQIFLKSSHDPIGHVTDYFYRVEFQQRGSPHIHMLVWIDNAPKYPKDDEETIVKFVDKYVSCSNHHDSSMSYLVDLQTHKHSKTCRKKGKAVCRFGFPLPPLRKTVLLEPLDLDVDKYKKKYDKIQDKMNNYKDGMNFSFEQFLTKVAEMSEEEYIKCIRSSINGPKVFLKRQPSEIRINLYNEHLLCAWNANIDLQYVLDPYACAMYIVSYISKSQRGMSALLDRACKEARQGNMDIKRQVRHIGNQFLNSVEVSAQEAAYLVLQMPLTKGSRDVLFLSTSPPDERVQLLKQKYQLEELSPDSTDIHHKNIFERYAKRPKQLERWCLADYASQLEVKYPEKETPEVFEEVPVNDDDVQSSGDESDEKEFSENKTVVTLKNGIVIRRRSHALVIRYVHYSAKTDPENHYREKLLLFMPWRDERVDLLNGKTSYKTNYEEKRFMVDMKVKQYEKNMTEIEQAMQAAENDFEQYDELAPNAQEANAVDEAEGQEESVEYVHFNPDRPVEQRHYDIGSEIGVATSTACVECHSERIPDDQYLEIMRSLNFKQREFFNHVLHWLKTKDEPIYAFLSGGAGVGKSVLIKALYQALHRHLHSAEGEDPDDVRILLCAFTGKAAYNINGVTIASAFHKKFNQSNQSLNADELNTFRMKYRNLSVVIVDEVSMVGNKMLTFMDTRLKQLTGTNKTFGGISIIAVGDLYQLQPVGDSWIFNDLSHGPQILATNLWKDHFSMFEMTQIMRQQDDMFFANLLNRLRTNELTEVDKVEIEKHYISPGQEDYQRNAPHLFVENKFVDSFNEDFIRTLSSAKEKVDSHDDVISDIPRATKDRLISNLPKDASKTANLPHSLILAIGMIYDITVNLDVNDGIANGSTCIIKCIEHRVPETARPSIVWVLFNDSSIGSKTRQKYKHLYHPAVEALWTPVFDVTRNFLYNYKSYQRTQFPLKPAAAKTVHKAQGSTMDEVVIDLSQSRTRKTPHIHYVAMSRVRKFENLRILNFNEDALAVDERVKDEMKRLRENACMKLCYEPLYLGEENRLKVAMNNARSYHKHFPDVSVDPNILAADVIGIMESRLCHIDENETYRIHGYDIYRCDQQIQSRSRRPSHGLLLYVRNGFDCTEISQHSTNLLEFLFCHLIHPVAGFLQLVLVYKSPSCTLQEFRGQILRDLLPDLDIGKPLLIMGDFNFDISTGNVEFLHFMTETFECTQHVLKPTTNMMSLLDLVFTNIFETTTETIECYWSDHKIVTAVI